MVSAHCGSAHGVYLHKQAGEPPCFWCASLDPGFRQAQEATRERITQLEAALAGHQAAAAAEQAALAEKLHRAHAEQLETTLAEQRATLTAEHNIQIGHLQTACARELQAALARQHATLTAEHAAHTTRLQAARQQDQATAESQRAALARELEMARQAPAATPRAPAGPRHRHYLIAGAVIGASEPTATLRALATSGHAQELDAAGLAAHIAQAGG